MPTFRNFVKNTRRQFSNDSSGDVTQQQGAGLFPLDRPSTINNNSHTPGVHSKPWNFLRLLSRCSGRRITTTILKKFRSLSAITVLSALLAGLVFMVLLNHMYMTDEWDRIQRDTIIGSFGNRGTILGGFHVVGRRDVPVDPILLSLEHDETRVHLPRDMGHRRPDATPPPAPEGPMTLFCPILPLATPPQNTNPHFHHSSKSARSVVYNTSGDQYAWLRSSVGAHGSWVAKLSSVMKREFAAVSDGNLGADVPLLQPLWGTLEAFTAAGLTSRVLSGPPPLPQPTSDCGDGRALRPLVVLPARWVQRIPTTGDEGGVPVLAVPPAVSLNVLTMAAQALAFSGPMTGATPSFRVPVFATGGMHSVAAVVEAVELATTSDTPTPTTSHPRGELWGLLGISSAEAGRVFRAALIEDAATAHVELRIAGSARVVRVRPECGGVGECAWCDEVTVAVPLQLRAGAAGRVLQMAVWVSVTEIVCSDGGAAPRVADSLAAAVHLGTLMGSEEGITHVVVLGEDHVVHTLAHLGGDREFYRDGLLGGGSSSSSGSYVGHTFLEQALGAWAVGGGCGGPRAMQAIVVRLDTPPTEDLANATSRAALDTPTKDLVVEHHGVIFAGKTVTVPSWPMSKTRLVTNEGDACHEGHPCVRMRDMVNSIFHPFTTMEGVVSVRRRHLLPARTRRVLGVVDAAEVRDVLHGGPPASGVRGVTRQALEAVDAVSPLAVCIEARSFAQVNGLYGRGGGGRWVATVEDVAGALRSRVVPVVMMHQKRVECATGGGGVVGAALRVLRVVTRHVVGHGASHAGGEEAVVGSRLSSGLRDLSLAASSAQQEGGNNLATPLEEAGGGRPSLAQFVARRAPLVAASARVVRVPSAVRVTRGDAIDEATLWLLLGPRFVHAGSTSDVQGSGMRALETSTLADLVLETERVSRALYRIVAGAPTNVCVPDGLLAAVRAHSSAMAGYLKKGDRMPLEERLQREFSPWRHAQCSGEEDLAVCVARAQLRHMQQMLECDAMGEWVRRVSDDMRVLTQPDMSTMADFNAWSSYEPEKPMGAESNMWLTKRFLEDSITQATALGVALCERWGCRGNTTSSRKIPVDGAVFIVERQQTDTKADVPGAEADMTRTVGMGELSDLQVGSDSEAVRFLRHVLSTAVPPEVSRLNVSIGHVLQSGTGLCPVPEACAAFPADVGAGSISGPLTLWQQWALRYVRMLLQTADGPGALPQHRQDTSSTTIGEHSVIRAQSGHARLFDGHWGEFAWGSLGARTKLSLDFALKRFLPSGDDGSGPGGAAVASLVRAQSVEAADAHMTTALLHLSATELAPMLRMPLFKEGLAAAEFGCIGESRRVVASPMPISRAVVRHLRTRSWDMGPDSVVDYLDRTKGGRLDCALRGLTWLERGWSVTGSGIVEGELYSWLAKKSNPQTLAAAANHLSFMFARDLRCVFPQSTLSFDRIVGNISTVPSKTIGSLYALLLSIVRHAAINLVDSTSSMETLLMTELGKKSYSVTTSCTASFSSISRYLADSLHFDQTALLWRIPCFGCSGFMRETMTYLPPLIEEKGIPMSVAYEHEECLCDMATSETPTKRDNIPKDVFRRSVSAFCDNDCVPWMKSGTTALLSGEKPYGVISNMEKASLIQRTYFSARQRYYRGHPTTKVKDASRIRSSQIDGPQSTSAIWIDSMNPDGLIYSSQKIAPFLQVDMASVDGVSDSVAWGASTVVPPVDKAIERNLFTAYNELGEADPSRSTMDNVTHKGKGQWGSSRAPPRRYRICRSMYESDRLRQAWAYSLAKYCDEIWVPGNWVKRMFVNSFVTPLMEIAFVPRAASKEESLNALPPCMGCVDMTTMSHSSPTASLLLPPTTPFQPLSINIDELRLRSDIYLGDEDMTIERIQKRISEDESIGYLEGLSHAFLRLLGQEIPPKRRTLLQHLIKGMAYQVLPMLRQLQPVVRFVNTIQYSKLDRDKGVSPSSLFKQPYMADLVAAVRDKLVSLYSVHGSVDTSDGANQHLTSQTECSPRSVVHTTLSPGKGAAVGNSLRQPPCRPPLVVEIGNSTHQLAYRLHFKSLYDLSKIVVIPESVDIHTKDPSVVDTIDEYPISGLTHTSSHNAKAKAANNLMSTTEKRELETHTFHNPSSSNTNQKQDLPHRPAQILKPERTPHRSEQTPHRPGLFQPGDTSYGWERWCARKCFRGTPGKRRFISREESFRFMSVFKWEPRKGWHGLMEAYYRAFYSPLYTNRTQSMKEREPMLIVVGAPYTPTAETFNPAFLSSNLVEKWFQSSVLPLYASSWMSNGDRTSSLSGDGNKEYSLGMADFPCTCFLTSTLSDSDLVSLYRSVDAFVITTRGEGWGLPISEAMAMGLPTISTDWGGSTEFTSHGSMPAAVKATRHEMPVSYPINASIVEVPQLADGYGGEHNMRMAAPSVPHTVELLRKVYEQTPEVNQEVGRRARDVIVRQFSQAATTDMMTVRLAAVAQKLRWETDEERALGPEQQTRRLKVRL